MKGLHSITAPSAGGRAATGRIPCSQCATECLQAEMSCWRCGTPLNPAVREEDFITFHGNATPNSPAARLMEAFADAPVPQPAAQPAAEETWWSAPAEPKEAAMYLTFCKGCGQQNEEGSTECRKCMQPLEKVALGSVKEIENLPRAWGFDVLGLLWLLLGFAAIYCGQFLIKVDHAHTSVTWTDYFWTGSVVCAPGLFVFMRHCFCKWLFEMMTLGRFLVWMVVGFLWLFVGLQVSEVGRFALIWFALLSGLVVLSHYVVSQNDAFDYAA